MDGKHHAVGFLRSIIAWLCLTVLAVWTSPGCSPEPESTVPIHTDVCEMVASPKKFAGRRVAVDTFISSDGKHLVLLMGPACDRGIQFLFASSVPQATQDQIRKAIYQPWPGTSGKKITARFAGTLRYDRQEKRGFPYYLEIENVSHLTVDIGRRPW